MESEESFGDRDGFLNDKLLPFWNTKWNFACVARNRSRAISPKIRDKRGGEWKSLTRLADQRGFIWVNLPGKKKKRKRNEKVDYKEDPMRKRRDTKRRRRRRP